VYIAVLLNKAGGANVSDHAVLSIDIGGSKLMAGLIDMEGKVIIKERETLSQDIARDQLLNKIVLLVEKVRKACPGISIEAAGVAIPGLADPQTGLWVYSCFSGISDFPIASELSALLGLPVFIDNDVNVCAYGEKIYGICRDADDFFWVTVSNGIGGGLVLNGELYHGAYGSSGEIGHVIVEEVNGRLCPCGNRGCLEAQASGQAISKAYHELTGKKGVTAKAIGELAKAGDDAAIQVYREAGYYLGKGIAAFVNALNPAKVVLGGGVSMDAELFMPSLRETVDKYMFKRANQKLLIERTGLGYDAALIGAAAIAWKGIRGSVAVGKNF